MPCTASSTTTATLYAGTPSFRRSTTSSTGAVTSPCTRSVNVSAPPPLRTRNAPVRSCRFAARSASVRFAHMPGYNTGPPCGAAAASAISRRVQKHSYTRFWACSCAMASLYSANRSLCTTGSPIHVRPTAANDCNWLLDHSGDDVTRSRSSIRTRKSSPRATQLAHAAKAVRRLPTCNSPVGDGANRPVIPATTPAYVFRADSRWNIQTITSVFHRQQ